MVRPDFSRVHEIGEAPPEPPTFWDKLLSWGGAVVGAILVVALFAFVGVILPHVTRGDGRHLRPESMTWVCVRAITGAGFGIGFIIWFAIRWRLRKNREGANDLAYHDDDG